jgi:hypothetical protein
VRIPFPVLMAGFWGLFSGIYIKWENVVREVVSMGPDFIFAISEFYIVYKEKKKIDKSR